MKKEALEILNTLKEYKEEISNEYFDLFLEKLILASVGLMASDGEFEKQELEMYVKACTMLGLDLNTEIMVLSLKDSNIREKLIGLLVELINSMKKSGLPNEFLKTLLILSMRYLKAAANSDGEFEEEEALYISPLLEIYESIA
jgi:hypothetical protein